MGGAPLDLSSRDEDVAHISRGHMGRGGPEGHEVMHREEGEKEGEGGEGLVEGDEDDIERIEEEEREEEGE